jgi:hypothetical protein
LKTTTYYYISRSTSFSKNSRFSRQYIDDGILLLSEMIKLDRNWQERAQSLLVSTILKSLYLGDFNHRYRTCKMKQIGQMGLFPISIDISNFPRFPKILSSLINFPLIALFYAWVYKKYIHFFNKPI